MDKLGNKVWYFISPENDNGNVEYKWSLNNRNPHKIGRLVSQMKWRLLQGSLKSAFYIIGVHDNGGVTGLPKEEFAMTYRIILECSTIARFCSCIKRMTILPNGNVWAVIQIFPKVDIISDNIPAIPKDNIIINISHL